MQVMLTITGDMFSVSQSVKCHSMVLFTSGFSYYKYNWVPYLNCSIPPVWWCLHYWCSFNVIVKKVSTLNSLIECKWWVPDDPCISLSQRSYLLMSSNFTWHIILHSICLIHCHIKMTINEYLMSTVVNEHFHFEVWKQWKLVEKRWIHSSYRCVSFRRIIVVC
jgi:hypothetical protein